MTFSRRWLGLAHWAHSLRFQVAAWYIATLSLILLFVGLIVYFTIEHDLLRATDQTLSGVAKTLMVQIRYAGGRLDAASALAQIDHRGLTTDQGPPFIRLADTRTNETLFVSRGLKHTILTRSLALLPPPPVNGVTYAFTGSVNDSRVRVLAIRLPETDQFLQATLLWDPSQRELDQTALRIASIILSFLLISAFGARAMVSRALSPVDAILTSAERLSAERITSELLPPSRISDNEIGHLVEALNGMMARLHDAFERQRQFTADASHELKTPLTIMRGEMEVALMIDRTPEQYRRVLRSGLEEVNRLSRTVRDLAELARADAAAVQPYSLASCVDVCDVVSETAVSFSQIASGKDISLVVEAPDVPVLVSGDPDALKRLTANLIQNALAYTGQGGRVEARVASGADLVRIVVADTGTGIAAEDLPRIFDRFYRADKARAYSGGAGLGLAIVKCIAEAHGGQVDADSRIGRGSTFTVVLPAYAPRAPSVSLTGDP